MAMRDLAGKRFGRLAAIEAAGKNRQKNYVWRCLCDCGHEVVVSSSNLIRGNTQSCGCLANELTRAAMTTHGLNGTGAHKSWMSMRQRCLNPKNRAFPSYGGRGIKICPQWDSFATFFADMGDRPPGLELDRIDVNGHYEPGNCRWATPLQQGRNQRKTRMVTMNGVTKALTEWAEELGVNPRTVNSRLHYGWSVERALTEPKIHNGGRPARSAV